MNEPTWTELTVKPSDINGYQKVSAPNSPDEWGASLHTAMKQMAVDFYFEEVPVGVRQEFDDFASKHDTAATKWKKSFYPVSEKSEQLYFNWITPE